MSKSNGASSAVGKFFTYVLVVLLVLGVAGLIAFFALRAGGVTFTVEYNGEQFFANSDGGSLTLLNGETHDFSVNSLTGEEVNFDVKVQSNASNNFDFTVDGDYWQFNGTAEENNDYGAVFGLEKRADGFSLTIPEGFTVEQAVEEKYGGEIELMDGYEIEPDLSYFVITVTSGEYSVSMWFRFFDFIISLDKSEIVF